MANKPGTTIVIKKVVVAGAGHHGGSWKVALADFMTAMTAFFLVMWLLGQSEETKKAVSDYFSTPSIIEYNFQNFGVEITLEKLFLDLINEPLKAFQQFMEPIDKTPNVLDFGSSKVVKAFLMDQLGDVSTSTTVSSDGFDFEIPDSYLFEKGSSEVTKNFVKVMNKVIGVLTGLNDGIVHIESDIVRESVEGASDAVAKKIAAQRLILIKNKINSSLEHNTVDVQGGLNVEVKPGEANPEKLVGKIKFSIHQKDLTSEGKKTRKLETLFGESDSTLDVYENFINQAKNLKGKKRFGRDETLQNPVDQELENSKPQVIKDKNLQHEESGEDSGSE